MKENETSKELTAQKDEFAQHVHAQQRQFIKAMLLSMLGMTLVVLATLTFVVFTMQNGN